MTRLAVRLCAGVLLVPGLAGLAACSEDDPYKDYWEAVKESQRERTELTAEQSPTALLSALDIFRELQEEAPRDITDEWKIVVDRLEALEEALEGAGVDPAEYDAKAPPEDLTSEEQRRIQDAAGGLVAAETVEAFAGLQQQARDVCRTPLTL